MKKIIYFTFCLFFLTSIQYLHAQWAKTYGGSDDDYASSIRQTSDGGYIVAGQTESFGFGNDDLWILKLDSNGDIEWQKAYGLSHDDRTYDKPDIIHQTSDGGYIVTCSSKSFSAGENDIWILKLSSNGDIEWQKIYGGNSWDNPNSICQTIDGGYIVAGFTQSFGDDNDYWVLKLSSYGNIEWQKIYNGGWHEHARTIWQTDDEGYIVAGNSYSFTGSLQSDIWILKLSSNGDIEWQKTYGGSKEDVPYSIQQTSDGGYIVGGETNSFGVGYYDIWILKLSSNGDIEWQNTYGDSFSDNSATIKETSDGGYIVRSWFYKAGKREGRVLKLFSSGDIEWQNTYGGSDDDGVSTIQETNDGGYIAGGWTWSYGAGSADFMVAKVYSDGNIDSSCDFIGDSIAAIVNTDVSPEDTDVTPNNTDVSPVSTYVSPLNTYATVSIICEAPEFFLTIIAAEGGTTDPAPDVYNYYAGTEVTIESIADNGYEFDHWTGDVPSGHENDNPLTITMDADKSITANFRAISQCELTIIAGEGGTTNPAPGSHSYNSGTTVTVTATADNGYRFVNWSGDVSSTDNPVEIIMDSNKTITANFVRQYTLNITTGSGGTTAPEPGTYIYDQGTEVTITANPGIGYEFSGWTGDVPSGQENDNPLTITVDADKSITANFQSISQCELTIIAGEGGTTDPAPGSHSYNSGTTVTVTATADGGYRFGNWSGDVSSTDNPVEIIMDGDKTITANFVRQYTLNITTGSGGTTDPVPGEYTYDDGTEVTIEASPDEGYRFSGWSGDVPAGHENDNPLTITMNGDKSVTANFIRLRYTLTIAAGSHGTTDPPPGSYEYDSGVSVTVTAKADSGYEFDRWSGDASGTSKTITITMDSDKSITAHFKEKEQNGILKKRSKTVTVQAEPVSSPRQPTVPLFTPISKFCGSSEINT